MNAMRNLISSGQNFPQTLLRAGLAGAIVLLTACGSSEPAPSADSAASMISDAEDKLYDMWVEAGQAAWIQNTYIIPDSEAVAARAAQRSLDYEVQLAKDAAKFDGIETAPDVRRKLDLLKTGPTLAPPADPKESREVTELAAKMEGIYGKGVYCRENGQCLDVNQITEIMANSRNEKELLEVWNGWRTISQNVPPKSSTDSGEETPSMRKLFTRFVDLSNKGARELGFADTGAMWRSKYDMPADDFTAELDRLWDQVRPLYESLHAYVRRKLREKYGADVVPADGPIPAHLLGNIWAQDWSNVYDLVAPPAADPGYDLTKILQTRGTTPIQMVKYGEGFFESLGFKPLPDTFWERSLFTKPRDREVVCHASAWDITKDDYRIKMCININAEDFITIHHELGHNFYQRAYNDHQPLLFRNSANDGFHEAIGDTIALSITPEYLKQLGFIDTVPDASKDLGLLMQRALEKVAFLPFGLLIDQWRWKVFSGEITPEEYTKAWWDLRLKYQGIAPPEPRPDSEFFDPGAKYHVPANVPYTRYFLAHILQFQFHRELAKIAGCGEDGATPLNRCSIYNSKEAGEKLNAMLELGQSRPWQEALETMTGSPNMDATAIRDYFAPLQAWLDEQNEGQKIGW